MKFGVLWVTTADGAVRDYPLDLPNLLIGRADGNSIVVDDRSVARRHARLAIDSGRLLVEDLGSAEGTFVAGYRIPPYTPSLVESGEELRLGEVSLRYQAPAGTGTDQLGPMPFGMPQPTAEADEDDDAPAELLAGIRVFFAAHPPPVEPGAAAGIATLTVQNRSQVVDELTLSVEGIPEEWVRIANPRIVLLPGDSTDVPIIFGPPRRPDARAGEYDVTVVIASGETSRQVLATTHLSMLPFRELVLSLHPVRAKRQFEMEAGNRGNAPAVYAIEGVDDEERFRYEFPMAALELQPGETRRYTFKVRNPGRRLFGLPQVHPFRLIATPAGGGEKVQVDGQLHVKPPLQPYRLPAFLLIIAGLLAFTGFCWWYGPPSWLPNGPGVFKKQTVAASAASTDPEAAYAGVHMCLKKPKPLTVSKSAAPFFKQEDDAWATAIYAKSDDAAFAKQRTCGTTLAQCGDAITSVSSIMNVFELLAMPDGKDVNPASLNDWANLQAQKTNRGWVSQGYVYGDVLWSSVNQLSSEIHTARPDARTIRYVRTTDFNEAIVRSELKAGRPVLLALPGHWVAAVNTDGDKILINDPYYLDRKSLDDYKGVKISSMALFDVTNQLGEIVVTAPSDMRIKVTNSKKQTTGSLNPDAAAAAKEAAQPAILGSSYDLRPAWRDPTCVESPPPPGAGTVQIVLPGSRDDYTIDVVSAAGGAASAVIDSYDGTGKPTVTVVDRDGPATVTLSYDPAAAQPTVAVTGAAPAAGAGAAATGSAAAGAGAGTGAAPGAGAAAAPGTGANAPGAAGATPGAAGQTPSTTAVAGTPTVPGAPATPTAPPTVPAGPPTLPPTPPLPPPNAVVLACTVTYQTAPKLATVTCNATVDGAFDTIAWQVNGISAPLTTVSCPAAVPPPAPVGTAAPPAITPTPCTPTAGGGAATYSTTFSSDTNLTIGANACNRGACRIGTTGVQVQFAAAGPAAAPTPVPGQTPTPTPAASGITPSGLLLTCGVPNGTGSVTCTLQETGTITSVSFSAPGADPPTQAAGILTFTTTVPPESTTKVTATACNFAACQTSATVQVDGGPVPTVTMTVGVCNDTSHPFSASVNGSLGAAPGTVIFVVDGAAKSDSLPLSGGTASFPLTGMTPGSSHVVSFQYEGSLTSRYRVAGSSPQTVAC